ncbi:hypothetical protein [Crenalkalicoccus roseus]|nr:hypothetical protein [Crenalkalicoccus roseus]
MSGEEDDLAFARGFVCALCGEAALVLIVLAALRAAALLGG